MNKYCWLKQVDFVFISKMYICKYLCALVSSCILQGVFVHVSLRFLFIVMCKISCSPYTKDLNTVRKGSCQTIKHPPQATVFLLSVY